MKPWMKTLLKRTAQTLTVLLVLLVGVHLVENWRGTRAWEAWKAERIAAGEVRDLNAYAPPPVPDAENFAKVPMIEAAVLGRPGAIPMKDLPGLSKISGLDARLSGDWRAGGRLDLRKLKLEELESWLAGSEMLLEAWAEASRRPRCRLLSDYGDPQAIPALLGFRALGRVYSIRARVNLHRGRAEAALQDVETGFHLVRHLEAEPHLTSQLLRLALTSIMLSPIYEGLEDRRWNEGHLARLEMALQGQDLVASLNRAWVFERIGGSLMGERSYQKARWSWTLYRGLFKGTGPEALAWNSLRLAPRGWFLQNLVSTEREQLQLSEVGLEPVAHRVQPLAVRGPLKFGPYTFLAQYWSPQLQGQNARCARAQAGLEQARVALALERHRLARKAYPASLSVLVPVFLPGLPHDLITGEALRYRLKPDGSYTLYAVGWDAKDDGGQRPQNAQNPTAPGDWVWR